MSDSGSEQPVYRKPELAEHGRLADLTQGTPGVWDIADSPKGPGEGTGAAEGASKTPGDS
jgi:hypothetical protein